MQFVPKHLGILAVALVQVVEYRIAPHVLGLLHVQPLSRVRHPVSIRVILQMQRGLVPRIAHQRALGRKRPVRRLVPIDAQAVDDHVHLPLELRQPFFGLDREPPRAQSREMVPVHLVGGGVNLRPLPYRELHEGLSHGSRTAGDEHVGIRKGHGILLRELQALVGRHVIRHEAYDVLVTSILGKEHGCCMGYGDVLGIAPTVG
mmetsp:Transcript_10243/g.25106  ORF Transcript_10243/g.25106 Transcript_10243/m.25106 type:complete len:204 (-) Transcript_10243:396-1007(-)